MCIYFTLQHMNNKIDLFLDFDDTICLTSKQFVKLANKKYKKEEDWNNINRWDFKDLYPEITNNDIDNIFSSEDFFVGLELCENCLDVINSVKNLVNIHIATIGTDKNLKNKMKWIKENLNMDFNFNGILDTGINDKSSIDMSGAIFVDDRIDNLRSSNANIKILYRNYHNYSWQQIEPNDNIYVVDSWKQIYSILDFISKNPEFI